MGRLTSPAEAVSKIADRLDHSWSGVALASLRGEPFVAIEYPAYTGIRGGGDFERLGFDLWHEWRKVWIATDLRGIVGVELESRKVSVRGLPYVVPKTLRITTLEAALRMLSDGGYQELVDCLLSAVSRGRRMLKIGATLDADSLRRIEKLADIDFDVLINAVVWLADHPDLSEWTSRQLPLPQAHTKWLETNESLVRRIVRRTPTTETKPRLSVAHLTYVDPHYRAAGGRLHDAWTTGDSHALAYQPRVVVVVENRDCRLWFPEMENTIIVEGEGKAASNLATIDWVVHAEHLFYWGDLDSEGYAILNNFRGAVENAGGQLASILMDAEAWLKYQHLGVNHDKDGKPLGPSRANLTHLSLNERDGYAYPATRGAAKVRRVEQERIPLAEVRAELTRLLAENYQRPRGPSIAR